MDEQELETTATEVEATPEVETPVAPEEATPEVQPEEPAQ
jgi:hypothetical protein